MSSLLHKPIKNINISFTYDVLYNPKNCTQVVTFIRNSAATYVKKIRRRLGTETTCLDLEIPSRLVDFTAATLRSKHNEPISPSPGPRRNSKRIEHDDNKTVLMLSLGKTVDIV